MYEALMEGAELAFPKKAVLTVEEVAQILDCNPKIIYNWTRRSDPKRRPPKLMIGKEIRFPKREFFRWLAEDQEK